MAHDHHHDVESMGDRRLGWAIAINMLLTLAQVVGGILSGSLALIADALASLGVIVAGTLILLYEWYWTDTVLTLLIAGYVLYQAATLLPQTIHILMQGAPEGVVIDDVIQAMEKVEGVVNVHHVHIWQLDEHSSALEAHVVIVNLDAMESVKMALKTDLAQRFNIAHSALEFEVSHCGEGCS